MLMKTFRVVSSKKYHLSRNSFNILHYSSCYGDFDSDSKHIAQNRTQTNLKCPSLPLKKKINYEGSSVEIELSPFNPGEIEQGFKLMNEVIIEGKTWPFSVLKFKQSNILSKLTFKFLTPFI